MEETPRRRVRRAAPACAADDRAVAQEIIQRRPRSESVDEVGSLRGHMVALEVTLSSSTKPCSQELDFLLQKMNREVNTRMTTRAENSLQVTKLVTAAKAELEGVREQVPECRIKHSGTFFILLSASGAGNDNRRASSVEQTPHLKMYVRSRRAPAGPRVKPDARH